MKNRNQLAEDYVRQWAGHKTPDEMAEELFFSRSWVINIAARIGVSVVLKDNLHTRERVKNMILKHSKTKTQSEIARLAGVPAGTVRWYAQKMGIKMKPYKRILDKTPVESNYFNEQHEGAWLVG